VLVTAIGDDSEYCNVNGWTTNQVSVYCYRQDGAPINARFDVTFQSW